MRILILGGTGMLGQSLLAAARTRGYAALALSREQADIEDAERLRYWAETFQPEAVINCAAYTKVDLAEGEGREKAFAVNGRAVRNVAAAAGAAGARLLHVSTDYVFDGKASEPYREDAPTHPLSVYGKSKLLGEREALAYDRALAVRTSWLFGPGGPNFVATMVRLIEERKLPLKVVHDQEGCPTYTPYLAEALLDLAPRGLTGVVHYRNRERVSWHGFAEAIARLWAGTAVEVEPVTTQEFPRPAPRPAYSVLDVSRFEQAFGRRVEAWEAGLADYLSGMRRQLAAGRSAEIRKGERR
jgi:dTDP-4-dehydrorhamnose reductase